MIKKTFMKISVVIIEDDKNYNQTLKKALENDDNLICVKQFYSGRDALENLPNIKVDVVIVDLQLHDFTGFDLIKMLKIKMPDTNFIVCSNFDDEDKIFSSLKAGAIGYLVKGESLEKIVNSIKEAYSGGVPMSNNIARKVLKYFNEIIDSAFLIEKLTLTEMEILKLLSEGHQYKEIAFKKYVSTETIKKHIGNIYKKLGVNNKVEAINCLKKNKF